MPDFLPRSDVELLGWSRNFLSRTAAAPEVFTLPPELVAEYATRHEAFLEAFALAAEPLTRTPVVIKEKAQARAALVDLARRLASRIRATPAVTDPMRVEIGLPPRKPRRRYVPPPEHAPRVTLVETKQQTVRLRLNTHDSTRSMPAGAIGAVIRAYIGDTPPPPSDREQWRLQAMTSRSRVDVRFKEPHPFGTRVWLTASWMTARAEESPISTPVGVRLLGGLIVPDGLRRAA